MTKMNTVVFLLLMTMGVVSCKKEEVVECDGTVYSFSQQVQPLMNKSCNTSGCHSQNSTLGDFTAYNGVRTKVDNGSLKARILDGTMPVNTTLTVEEKKIIVCWVEAGALDN